MKPVPLPERETKLVGLFRALGHPARLRIMQLLAQRGTCVCGELVNEVPLSQSTVSQHLKVLRDSGLIVGEVEGPATCYCLSPGAGSLLREAGQVFAEIDSHPRAEPFEVVR